MQSTCQQPCGIQPHPADAANFVVIGDWGDSCETGCSVAVSQMVSHWDDTYGIDFIVTTGDNNYPNGNAADLVTNLALYPRWAPPQSVPAGYVPRFFPTLGNHDTYTGCGQPYLDRFGFFAATSSSGNARYYNYAVPEPANLVEIFAINANDNNEPDGTGADSVQAQWLQKALAASRARWKIVTFHEPPIGSSTADGYSTMTWPFAEWGASVVLMGHKHLYERIQWCGITWVINGLGGTQGVAKFDCPTPVPGSRMRFDQSWGAMLGVATRDQLTFCFLAITSDNPNGACIDQFTVGRR